MPGSSSSPAAQKPADRELARHLWLAALDRQAVFAVDSALTLFRSAQRADPSFFPAHLDYWELSAYLGRAYGLREEYAQRADLPAPVRQCMVALVWHSDDPSPRWLDVFREIERRHGRTTCSAYGLAKAYKMWVPERRAVTADELAAGRVIADSFPEHLESQDQLLSSLERLGRLDEAVERARRVAAAYGHPLNALGMRNWLVRLLVLSGDSGAARGVYLDAVRLAERDGRGYVRLMSLSLLSSFGTVPSDEDARARAAMRVAAASGVRELVVGEVINTSGPLLDKGRFAEALALIRQHTAWVDARRLVTFQMRLRRLEGRGLVRSGKAREGIASLNRAMVAANTVGHAGVIADVAHQLAHAYEALGEWVLASRAAHDFIAAADRTLDPGVHVISRYDAAAILWKAGWHAAADSMSRRMVEVIERERLHWAYAAEYYERIGDLGTAAKYLERARVPDAQGNLGDRNVVYAGLVRLHLALGRPDSALAAARVHDGLIETHDQRLVPQVLAATGRGREAVEQMREWTDLQADRANVGGLAKALVALADALVTQSPAEALEVATAAERAARAHHLTPELVASVRLRGAAAARLGRPDAIPLLRAARSLALTHPDALQRLLVEVALGDALCDAGQHGGALARYADAIALVERSGGTLEGDVDAARYRATRARAFSGALRAVLRRGGSADELLRWSARGKAREEGVGARASLSAIRAGLRGGEALLDYIVVDSAMWVVVVDRRAATVTRLPATSFDAEKLVRRILRPFTMVYGGRLDLARAPFDTAAAEKLYDALLRPVEERISGATHLVIIPDAPLHSIPFDALVVSRAGSAPTFVVDRWVTRYAAAPVVARGRSWVRADARVLLVAGNAPGTAVERALVSRAGFVDALEGANATESAVLRRAREYPILHIASHARTTDRDPLASYLALEADTTNDGLFHYNEIAAARFANALVVLNACDTSAGELLAGSGFMSLARAFLVSGSDAVIATRWPVGDASATLAASFYQHLRAGSRVEDALQRARLRMRGAPSTAHPFYWASHVILGRV